MNRIGPATIGRPTSTPATAGPQRRPARDETTTSAGARKSFSSRTSTCGQSARAGGVAAITATPPVLLGDAAVRRGPEAAGLVRDVHVVVVAGVARSEDLVEAVVAGLLRQRAEALRTGTQVDG